MKILFVLASIAAISMAQSSIQDEMVRLHNSDRPRHQVGTLSTNNDIVRNAQVCAQRNADRGSLIHDCPNASGYGENLAGGSALTAAVAYNMWYGENKLYDYNKPGFSGQTGHFTQVVWKGTTQIGCAIATGKFIAISCLYSPPGNYLGQFPQNVFPPL